MDNNLYIFLHLSTVDLAPNFSESNYIYHYYKWYKLSSDNSVLRIIVQTFDKNSCYIIIQPLAKFNYL